MVEVVLVDLMAALPQTLNPVFVNCIHVSTHTHTHQNTHTHTTCLSCPLQPLEALLFALRAVGLDLSRRAVLRTAAPQALQNTARITKRALGLEHEIAVEELRADAERFVALSSEASTLNSHPLSIYIITSLHRP